MRRILTILSIIAAVVPAADVHSAPACGPTVGSCGSIIIDNTANPGRPGLVTNMDTNVGGKAFGVGNSFKIDGIQVMQRKGTSQADIVQLMDQVGVDNPASTSYGNYGADTQLTFFNNGSQLFDLDRFRATADWLRANVAATASHPAASYGTISWTEFLGNVRDARIMYGFVRIKVPLQLTGATGRNALDYDNNQPHTPLYGFCSTTAGLCSAAPNSSTDIGPTKTVSGVAIPDTGQIRVRGALMFDFVDNLTGSPVSLINLPWDPRAIYFKVSVPISVNGPNDADANGVLDNIGYIDAITTGLPCAVTPCSILVTRNITYDQVPQESKDAFLYQYGTTLTQALFDSLSEPNKYHLLMASGYPYGWHDAFRELGITSTQWQALGFETPDAVAADGILSVDEIRSDNFEDIPVYIYTGGLVDMHHHVNVSGLVYVPQAMELEQKQGSTRQYISGGVIVRDGFFIEARSGGVTLISSDPTSFAHIKVLEGAVSGGFSVAKEPGDAGGGELVVGNPAESPGVPGVPLPPGSPGSVGTKRWVEIRPR